MGEIHKPFMYTKGGLGGAPRLRDGFYHEATYQDVLEITSGACGFAGFARSVASGAMRKIWGKRSIAARIFIQKGSCAGFQRVSACFFFAPWLRVLFFSEMGRGF